MAFVPFMVTRTGPSCTMKTMKITKEKRVQGAGRGRPLVRLVVKRSGSVFLGGKLAERTTAPYRARGRVAVLSIRPELPLGFG